jgi:putative membrane protein insertion efficiency factor
MKWIVVKLLRGYQLVVSPVLRTLLPAASGCRFEPSCSAYAIEAVQMHGAARGLLLAARRLARCHPWGSYGFDPVPAVCGCELRITNKNFRRS